MSIPGYKAGRLFWRKGETAEGIFLRPKKGSWDAGEYAADCHGCGALSAG